MDQPCVAWSAGLWVGRVDAWGAVCVVGLVCEACGGMYGAVGVVSLDMW